MQIISWGGLNQLPPLRVSPMSRTKPASPALKALRSQLAHVATLFKQASDATRLRILMLLAEEDHNVGQIVEELGLSGQSATSHHLMLMRHTGLVEPRRDGPRMVYSLTDKGSALLKAIEAVTT